MIRRDNICVVGLLSFITWFRPVRVVLSVEGVSTTLQTQLNSKLQKILVEYDL